MKRLDLHNNAAAAATILATSLPTTRALVATEIVYAATRGFSPSEPGK
jgi:hypothetical protein